MEQNVGSTDKAVRIAAGSALLLAGILKPMGIVARSITLFVSAGMLFTAHSGR